MNLVFNGFRHYHILTCYKQAAVHKDIKILGAVEADPIARNHAEKTLGISVAETGMDAWLSSAAPSAPVARPVSKRWSTASIFSATSPSAPILMNWQKSNGFPVKRI